MLAFRHFPARHRRKIQSTNLVNRVDEEVKRRIRVVGIFPNDNAIIRLTGTTEKGERTALQLVSRVGSR